MTAFETLLPAPDTDWRCADYTAEIEIDPGGTAFAVDELYVADVSLPWPRPVFAEPELDTIPAAVERAARAGRRVRMLAAVPTDADGAFGRLVVHRLHDGGAIERIEHRVSLREVPRLVHRLLADGIDASPETALDRAAPNRELLICTQGSHDRCCGSDGTRLAAEIGSARPDVAIRRVSHTGGHRFAPTGLTLPGGRMWGGIDLDELMQILDRSGSPRALAPKCRGWIGATRGAQQVAERAVFAAVDDWGYDLLRRAVTTIATDEHGVVCRVSVDSVAWDVVVEPGREVPTIACSVPGGLPAKRAREYRVRSIQAVS